MAVIVGCDVGYGYTKVARGSRCWCFPSLVGGASGEQLTGLFSGGGAGQLSRLRVEIEGLGPFAVGELALNGSGDATRAFAQERWQHPSMRVLVDAAIALALAGGPAGGGLHLATGLPLAYWASGRRPFQEWARSLDDRVRLLADGIPSGWLRVTPQVVTVYPQAAGALYSALFDASGRLRERGALGSGGLIGVIDVGWRTTDYLVLDLDQGLQVREDLSGTEELGTGLIDQALQRAFRQRTGAVLPPDRLDFGRRRGEVTFAGRRVALGDARDEASSALAGTVADRVKAAWGAQGAFLSRLYLAGGGALALGEQLARAFPGATAVPDAQFANVHGFCAVAAAAVEAGSGAG